ncbi:MAG: phosphatase [Alkaliphilus sp.]|nr:phosphatase [bacterium AH-315-L21]MBN4056567.1 phosphatase [bacterium AH-315-K05]MBN4069640.1 phosphatase [bacterium AH-315-G05]MBN4074298.1 phosphatase [bacterium AH-315-E09]PHS31798.1 MAG: phosphatase [Alkaliphilus sp.]
MKYVLDTHCHTIASGHAYSTILEMADYAKKIDYKLIALTEHGPAMPGGANEIYFQNLKVLPAEINGVEIFKGAEVNILDLEGNLDLAQNILEQLDFVIASFHRPCIASGSRKENTKALIKVMNNPFINMIGHPGNPHFPIDIVEIVRAAKDTKTLIEINNSSLKPGSFRKGSKEVCYAILKECKKQEVAVALGSDAHFMYDIGCFGLAREMIDDLKMPKELVANTSVELFKKAISKKQQ